MERYIAAVALDKGYGLGEMPGAQQHPQCSWNLQGTSFNKVLHAREERENLMQLEMEI